MKASNEETSMGTAAERNAEKDRFTAYFRVVLNYSWV